MIERIKAPPLTEQQWEQIRIMREKYQRLKPTPDEVRKMTELLGRPFLIEEFEKWAKKVGRK